MISKIYSADAGDRRVFVAAADVLGIEDGNTERKPAPDWLRSTVPDNMTPEDVSGFYPDAGSEPSTVQSKAVSAAGTLSLYAYGDRINRRALSELAERDQMFHEGKE